MDFSTLSAPIATVLGALVGATAGISGALLTTWLQLRLDRRRAAQTRDDSVAKAFAEAAQQLTIKMASALHSMCWLTWLAVNRGDRLTQANLDAYDAEIHKLLPEVLGYMSTVAALDSEAYEQLVPHVNELFALDGRIGQAGLHLDRDREKSIRQLADCYEPMTDFEHRLPRLVANIVGERLRTPATAAVRPTASRGLPSEVAYMDSSRKSET
jgi:hypothetical protein